MKTFKEICFHLKSLAIDHGILDGHSNYCKFIILARGRSGSNFLRSLLNAHSSIIAFGELFRFHDSIGWDLPAYDKYLQNSTLIELIQNDPVDFLREKVFRKFPPQISAVGFKIFYYHAQNDSRRVVWDYLRENKKIKIIHLKRNNTLNVILSLKKAEKTNIWTNTTGKEEDFSTTLDYEECLRAFIWTKEIKEKYDLFFKEHQKIDIFYENLSSDYKREIGRVQEFLGVVHEPVKPSTYKQSNKPASKAIVNYFELKEQFQNTPWEEFFEE